MSALTKLLKDTVEFEQHLQKHKGKFDETLARAGYYQYARAQYERIKNRRQEQSLKKVS